MSRGGLKSTLTSCVTPIIVSLTSRGYRRQTRQLREMRGSSTGKWRPLSSDSPSRASWKPDSWAADWSAKETHEMSIQILSPGHKSLRQHLLYWPPSCKTVEIVWWPEQQEVAEQTALRAWAQTRAMHSRWLIISFGHIQFISTMLWIVVGQIPSKSLSIYEL